MGAWSPSAERRAPSRSLTSPGALSGQATDCALLPFWPHLPGTGARAWRAWDGEGNRRDQEPGCLARSVIGRHRGFCWLCTSDTSRTRWPAFALPGTQGHLSPGSGGTGRCIPPPWPLLCRTGLFLSLCFCESCSSPSVICWLFLSTTGTKMLWGVFWAGES